MLDVATGTGDVAIELSQRGMCERRVCGIDFSEPMVRGAQRKLQKNQLSGRIALSLGDALALPFRENTFAASVMAFGLRNVPEKGKALSEMIRVTRWGGKVILLEFTIPRRGPLRMFYPFYFKKILPWVGGIISGDREAYSYLPESVSRFGDVQQYAALMVQCGLENVMVQSLTFDIVSLIVGTKRQP